MVRERQSLRPCAAGSGQTCSTQIVPKRTAPKSKSGVLIGVVFLLAACADDSGERVAGSAAMGGALGIPAGPIGIALGAGIGAAAGALTPKTVLDGSAREPGP
jgi:hypothetical protein